jgi:DNA-3-methyladenine glycosylase II
MTADVSPVAPVAGQRTGSYRAAALELADRDPVLARLVRDGGLPRLPRPAETHFATLVRSVVYQQLAGAAARAIHGRLLLALEDDVTPERVMAADVSALRAAGLSGRKAESLRDLAAKVLDGTVILEPRRLGRLDDEDIITRLSSVQGIGRWSAQIFLIYQLRRLDIWPTGDLGIRRGYGLAWGTETPSPRQLEGLGEAYRPYRTVVAWYCWRAVSLYSDAGTVTPVTGTGR